MKIFLLVLLAGGLGFVLGRVTVPVEEPPSLYEPVIGGPITPTPEPATSPQKVAPSPRNESVAATPAPALPKEAQTESSSTGDESDSPDSRAAEARGEERGSPKRIADQPSTKAFAAQWDPQVIERLDQTRKKNLLSQVRRSNPVAQMTPVLQGIMGRFEGDILIDESTGKTWQMTMDNQGRIVDGRLEGKSVIELSRNGKVFSSGSNTGQLQNIRQAGDKTSLLIQMTDSYYLEAFYDPGSDSIYGNCYSRNPKGDYRYRGVAQLSRR